MLKSKLMAVVISLAGLFLSACQSKAPETPVSANTSTNVTTVNKPVDQKVVEEVKEMLTKHDKALNDQNIDAVMETFSHDPKVVMLGTGQGERFTGQENIKNAYLEIFKDYDKGTLVTNCDWKTGDADANGKIAWMGATCQAKDSIKGKAREYVLNVSGAVVKEDAGWRFILLHMSNSPGGAPPPPPEEAKK
jgi:ketosteroid isomerase-like protein